MVSSQQLVSNIMGQTITNNINTKFNIISNIIIPFIILKYNIYLLHSNDFLAKFNIIIL